MKKWFSIAILTMAISVFWSLGAFGYILNTLDKEFSMSNLSSTAVDCDEYTTATCFQLNDYSIRVTEIITELGEVVHTKDFSRAGYMMTANDIRIVGNYTYVAGTFFKESTGIFTFYLLRINRANYITTAYYYDNNEFQNYSNIISSDGIFINIDGSLLTVVTHQTINYEEAIITRFMGNSPVWQTIWSMGSTTGNAITAQSSYVYVSGLHSFPSWYIAKFNYITGSFVDTKNYTSPFSAERKMLVSQMEADSTGIYVLIMPMINICYEDQTCEPLLYQLGQFNPVNLNQNWYHMVRFDDRTDNIILSMVLSSCDIFVSHLLINTPANEAELTIYSSAKEDGDSLGIYHFDKVSLDNISYMSKMAIYIRTNVNLRYVEDPLNQQRMVITELKNGNTYFHNFWVPRKMYISLTVHSRHWNLFCIPLLPDSNITPSFFKAMDAFDVIYKYDPNQGYIAVGQYETLHPGVGYWGYGNSDISHSFWGRELLQHTFAATDDWIMVGTGTYEGWIKEFETDDPICIMGFYWFDYYTLPDGGPTRLDEGYWVPPVPAFYFGTDQVEN